MRRKGRVELPNSPMEPVESSEPVADVMACYASDEALSVGVEVSGRSLSTIRFQDPEDAGSVSLASSVSARSGNSQMGYSGSFNGGSAMVDDSEGSSVRNLGPLLPPQVLRVEEDQPSVSSYDDVGSWRVHVEAPAIDAMDLWSNAPPSNGSGSGRSRPGRLRPRGRDINDAWRVLVGELAADRSGMVYGVVGQTSAENLSDWFKGIYGDLAKLRTVRRVRVGRPGDDMGYVIGDWEMEPKGPKPELDYDFVAEVSVRGGADVLRVSLRLLARLVVFIAARPRTSGALLMLRAKAAQYAKEISMSPEQLSWVIHGSVALAMVVCSAEKAMFGALQGVSQDMVDWSERFASGTVSVWRRPRWVEWWWYLSMWLCWLWALFALVLAVGHWVILPWLFIWCIRIVIRAAKPNGGVKLVND